MSLARRLERAVDDALPGLSARHGVIGWQAAVVLDGELSMIRTGGAADAVSSRPMTAASVVRAASNAKPVSTLIAMHLVSQGVLCLDAPIWQTVRSWQLHPDQCRGHDPSPITLRHLLAHTSGLTVKGFPQMPWATPAANVPSASRMLGGFFSTHGPECVPVLSAPPGETTSYSAAGFTLVQLAVEESLGRPFPAVAAEVLESVGLKSTWYGRREDRADSIATGHDASGSPVPRAFFPALASSGLYTTAAELARMIASAEPLTTPAIFEQLLTPQSVPGGEWAFGLGFALAECDGVPIYKHAGWSDGTWGAVEGLGPPFRRTASAVLTNSATGKDFALELLGIITQFLTSARLR